MGTKLPDIKKQLNLNILSIKICRYTTDILYWYIYVSVVYYLLCKIYNEGYFIKKQFSSSFYKL